MLRAYSGDESAVDLMYPRDKLLRYSGAVSCGPLGAGFAEQVRAVA